MPNLKASTQVALLSQTDTLGRHLHQALTELGVPIVYEALISEVERARLEASNARVIVVNLDADAEQHLEDIYDLFDDERYSVIFNDAQVSSTLSGWEQARWVRHLAAKILGVQDIDPPRPLNAEPIPAPLLQTSVDRPSAPILTSNLEKASDDAFDFSELDTFIAGPSDVDTPLDTLMETSLQSNADDFNAWETTESQEETIEFISSETALDIIEDTTSPHNEMTLGIEDLAESTGFPAANSPVVPSAPMWSLEDLTENTFATRDTSVEPGITQNAVEESAPFTLKSGIALELIPVEIEAPEERVGMMASESWLEATGTLRRIWVLGASIGGPEAIREFLALLPANYPALFLIVQHMGAEFIEAMIQQVAKATPLRVWAPTPGEQAKHGHVIVMPTTHRLLISADGAITFEPLPKELPYSPSIDQALHDIADGFGAKAGAIIFSGMANDAIEGSQYLVAKGGTVYAQDPHTCVISSMVDGVCAAGVVSFIGSPTQLAEKLLTEMA